MGGERGVGGLTEQEEEGDSEEPVVVVSADIRTERNGHGRSVTPGNPRRETGRGERCPRCC